MGGATSKVARTGGAVAARQYPTRTPSNTTSSTPRPSQTPDNAQEMPGPTVHSSAQPSSSRNEAIDLDARDPHFAQRLQEVGPVQQPSPTWSPSSSASPTPVKNMTFDGANPKQPGPHPGHQSRTQPSHQSNPALVVLAARERIAREAEEEKMQFGKAGYEGKQYVDIATVRKILVLRDEKGMAGEDIERYLRLRKGVVAMMGPIGTVEAA